MTRKAPSWPLLLKRDLAAIACDLKLAEFERAVAEGVLPQPVLLAGVEVWSIKAIEAALDTLTGASDDWRSKQPGLNRAA